jgi:hypothetical protein
MIEWYDSLFYYDNRNTIYDHGGRATHPSFNLYSRMELGENDCAIVWQEQEHLYDSSNVAICYTRIDATRTPMHYLPDISRLADPKSGTVAITAGIARLNDSSNYLHGTVVANTHCVPKYPVVYRSVDLEVQDYDNLRVKHWDRIMWHIASYIGYHPQNFSTIAIRKIDMCDSLGTVGQATPSNSAYAIQDNNVWHAYYPSYYLDYSGDTNCYPYISQGTVGYDPNRYYSSRLTLSGHNAINISIGDWHIRQSYWGLFCRNGTDDIYLNNQFKMQNDNNLLQQVFKLNSSGSQTHLANLPMVNDTNAHHFSRRIFNFGDINTTSEVFLKHNYNTADSYLAMFGFTDGTNSTKIGDCYIDDEQLYFSIFDTDELTASPKDTIVSQWFVVGDSSDISFMLKQYGTTNKMLLQIEERNNPTYSLLYVNTNEIIDTNFNVWTVQLNNGFDKEYRLRISPVDTTSYYNEDVFLGMLSGVGQQNLSLNKTADAGNRKIVNVDLTPAVTDEVLQANPIPASSQLQVSLGSLPTDVNDFILKMYSLNGDIVMETNISQNSKSTLNVSDISNGTYTLQIEFYDKMLLQQRVINRNVIISR